jgi:hypothetical protein
VAFDGLGNAFACFLVYNAGASTGAWVARSTDGGETYTHFVQVTDNADAPRIFVNPDNDDIYVIWNIYFVGNAVNYISKSTDNGQIFSPRTQVTAAASNGNAAIVRFGTGGEIYVAWPSGFAQPTNTMYFDRSMDGGTSWGPDRAIASGIVPPDTEFNGGFRVANVLSMDVDRSGGPYDGRIYVVFVDATSGDPDVMLIWSGDQGDSWSTPVRVNDDVVGNGADQWWPQVVVDGAGRVHATFLDRRDDAANYLYSLYLTTSTDGGASFGPDIRASDGMFGPTDDGFLGDYLWATLGGDRVFTVWPDGRYGDLDIFTHGIDVTDFDEDGVLNDGNGDGQYANQRCTGGATVGCDDNCPGVPNADQADTDGDSVGDACDNCLQTPNTSQSDLDRDAAGDACDGCPGNPRSDAGDGDGDGVSGCTDNCPDVDNPSQSDGDTDGHGDACDPCPASDADDLDHDGRCGDIDNCPWVSNPLQLDADADGAGDVCDVCPGLTDPGQLDTDGDGAGDACDCEPSNPEDLRPRGIGRLRSFKSGSVAEFGIRRTADSDVYSVVRGRLSDLSAGDYGDCFLEAVEDTGFSDAEIPPGGDGFTYLIQGQNFDCGMGTLGYASSEQERMPGGPACSGIAHSDFYAVSEQAIEGIVQGTLVDTYASDDVLQSITEEASGLYYSLNHTWTLEVTPGSRTEFHLEGYRTVGPDEEWLLFAYATDGASFYTMGFRPPIGATNSDLVFRLPDSVNGTVTIQLYDAGGDNIQSGTADTCWIDEMWIRNVP